MDKSWTHIRNRRSKDYWDGLTRFIEHARNYTNDVGEISCPCKKCLNHRMQLPDVACRHIYQNGFDPTYNRWHFHGEAYKTKSAQLVPESRDEMTSILNDVAAMSGTNDIPNDGPDVAGTSEANYIPNEIPVDMEDPHDLEFNDLVSNIQQNLYPGCTSYTTLNFLAKLLHVKALHKWTNASMDDLFTLWNDAFAPLGSKLPKSYYEAKKLLSKLGLGYETIHVCEHDCALFWKENADLQSCPICNTSRWENKNGKKVPRKVLRYFPLKDRLKRLYGSRHTAKEMTWHHRGRSTDPDIMHHPVDGKEWKEFDLKYPDFAHDPRNVRLALATDGFNPYGNMSTSYSMWPVVSLVLNLPPWICTKDTYMHLSLLIPGPKSPGRDINVYLQPLVDELQELWAQGVHVRDAGSDTNFMMRAALLMTINDFPARSILSGWSGQGYYACPTCNDDTPSRRITSKTCYVGHRRWLPLNHPMRKNKQFDGHADDSPIPIPKSTDQILEQLECVDVGLPGKHEMYGGRKRKRRQAELNWANRSIFWSLPYWGSKAFHYNLDVMHIEKNVHDNLTGTVVDIDGKSKDTDKARIDLKNMNVRGELHLYEEGGRWMKPHAPYTFTPEQGKQFLEFLKNIRLPDAFGSNLVKKVSLGKSRGTILGLKSHDCHIILQRLLPIGVRAFIKKDIADSIIDLSNFFKLICSRSLKVSELEKAKDDIVLILCKLETIFPPAFFDIMVHLVMHLPEEAIRGGPVHLRWMYPIERFLGTLKKYVRNRARPEGSIAEAYVVNETLTFCSMYFTGIRTKFNRPDRNWVEDDDASMDKIPVFQNQFCSIGKMTVIALDNNLRNKAEMYILRNCPEVQNYLEMHRNEIATACSATLLDEIQSEKYPSWFYNKVFSLRQQKSPDVTDQLWSLASGSSISVKSYPGCVINGVKYLTHQRDINRTTQNSGISIKGPGDQMYYGILEEIYEVLYIGGNSVILFKCKWFDNRSSRRREKEKYKNIASIYVKDTWYENEPFILASQAEQVFYVDDLLNGPNWKVVKHICHRHIWEPSVSDVIEDVTEDTITRDFELSVELPPTESSMGGHSNVQPSIVTSNVDAILNDNHEEDDFINDAEDATIHEYANDEEVTFDSDYDDDIEEVYTENVDDDNE